MEYGAEGIRVKCSDVHNTARVSCLELAAVGRFNASMQIDAIRI
jgi:hypothetical protein